LPPLRIVALTSAKAPGDRIKSSGAAVDAVLLKPVKQSMLLATLASALDPNADRLARPAPEALPAPLRPLRILLAEDNKVNQILARRLLENRGHGVVIVDNGLAAVAAAESGGIDLVLMDVQMPEMDGLEATKEIRRREPPGRRIPIVAMTAHAMKSDQERCLAAGMDDCIFKPVQIEELDRVVAEAMHGAVR
jgi:CheY-like chemotaxis protein